MPSNIELNRGVINGDAIEKSFEMHGTIYAEYPMLGLGAYPAYEAPYTMWVDASIPFLRIYDFEIEVDSYASDNYQLFYSNHIGPHEGQVINNPVYEESTIEIKGRLVMGNWEYFSYQGGTVPQEVSDACYNSLDPEDPFNRACRYFPCGLWKTLYKRTYTWAIDPNNQSNHYLVSYEDENNGPVAFDWSITTTVKCGVMGRRIRAHSTHPGVHEDPQGYWVEHRPHIGRGGNAADLCADTWYELWLFARQYKIDFELDGQRMTTFKHRIANDWEVEDPEDAWETLPVPYSAYDWHDVPSWNPDTAFQPSVGCQIQLDMMDAWGLCDSGTGIPSLNHRTFNVTVHYTADGMNKTVRTSTGTEEQYTNYNPGGYVTTDWSSTYGNGSVQSELTIYNEDTHDGDGDRDLVWLLYFADSLFSSNVNLGCDFGYMFDGEDTAQQGWGVRGSVNDFRVDPVAPDNIDHATVWLDPRNVHQHPAQEHKFAGSMWVWLPGYYDHFDEVCQNWGSFYLHRDHEDSPSEATYSDKACSLFHPVWNPANPVQNGVGTYTESVFGEPAHPCWQPYPPQAYVQEWYEDPPGSDNWFFGHYIYREATGEPEWESIKNTTFPDDPEYYDDRVYVTGSFLGKADVLQITVPEPGTSYATPIHFGTTVTLADWSTTNASKSTVEGLLRITKTDTDTASVSITRNQGLSLNKRLHGRFAKLTWKHSEANGTAKLTIGAHTWNLTGHAVAGTSITSLIDLCDPDASTNTTDIQSIIPLELPCELEDVTNLRASDTSSKFTWETPRYWGVGRITGMKLEVDGAADAYAEFGPLSLYRATEGEVDDKEGGFCKLVILPHQSPWVDSRQIGKDRDNGADPALIYGGRHNSSDPGNVPYWLYRKGWLIIDGAVVMEFMAGDCHVTKSEVFGDQYIYSEYSLFDCDEPTERDWEVPLDAEHYTPNYGFVFPSITYAVGESRVPATPGVSVNLVIGSTTNELLCKNLSVASLVGGIYTPDEDNVIKVSTQHYVTSINVNQGIDAGDYVDTIYGRWKGGLYGFVIDENGRIIKKASMFTVNEIKKTVTDHGVAESHEETYGVGKLGFLITKPVKTRYEHQVGTPPVMVKTSNRYMRRFVAHKPAVSSKGISLATSKGSRRVYLADIRGSGIVLRIYYPDSKNFIERTITSETADRISVCVKYGRVDKLVVIYEQAGTIKQTTSVNEGVDWSDIVTLWQGKTPQVAFSEADNAEIIAYLAEVSTGVFKICTRRKLGTAEDYEAAVEVCTADTDASSDIVFVPGSKTGVWVLIVKLGDGTLHRYTSSNIGRSWDLDE